MVFALVHYPAIDAVRIERLRKKYDPQVQLIAPHITIVFPVPDSIGEQHLVSHIQSVLPGCQPFTIRLKGLQLSSDNYLFLLVDEGKADLIRLHAEMYTGLLAKYRQDAVPYVPHVTLGSGFEDGARRQDALEEAERLNLDQRTVVDRLHLVKVNDERTEITWSTEFFL